MSGLCAVIRLDGAPAAVGEVEAMCDAASFRGPDGTGSWSDGPAALGQLLTRVAAEDPLTAAPLVAEGVAVVADIRLDNREELIAATGLARDATDVEIVAAAYRRWDDECAAHLVGDFAVVVWDRVRRRLFAARDPSGLRGLVFRHEACRRLLVASEVRQLVAAGVERRIAAAAVTTHLCGPYVSADRSFYAGVDVVAPGEAMTLGAGGLRRRRFWVPDCDRRIRFADERERAEVVREALLTAVRHRCRATGPVGLSLSGGVDSGSVAVALGEVSRVQGGPPVRTYSWAFDELTSCDERDVSDALSRSFGFTSVAVPADDGFPLAQWPEVAPHHDDPFHWPYEAINARVRAAAVGDGVRVMLTGSGGDEAFGDWIWDYPGMIAAGEIPELVHRLRHHRAVDGRRLASLVVGDIAAPVWRARCRWPALMRLPPSAVAARGVLTPAAASLVDLREVVAREVAATPDVAGSGRRLRYRRVFGQHNLRVTAADQLAHAEDGLVRADPLTDRRLVELVLSVPQYRVTRRDRPKALLRAAVDPLVPDGTTFLSDFTPRALWERGMCDRSVALVRELFRDSRLEAHGLARGGSIASEYERHLAGAEPAFDLAWALGAEMWLRTHWEGSA